MEIPNADKPEPKSKNGKLKKNFLSVIPNGKVYIRHQINIMPKNRSI
jgi:hypothetical protein